MKAPLTRRKPPSSLRAARPLARPAIVNGAAGVASFVDGKPLSVMGVTVVNGRIAEIYILADPARLRRLDLAALAD